MPLSTIVCHCFSPVPIQLVIQPDTHKASNMSDDGYDIGTSASRNDDVGGGWGTAPSKKDDLAIAIEKEKIIK